MKLPNLLPIAAAAAALAALPFAATGQETPQQPRITNLIANGGFERSAQTPNLWDGVDASGKLASWRQTVPALVEAGGIGDLLMPVSIAAADVTNNGLPDLVVANPVGYFFLYPNSGTREEAKFTHGEILSLFISSPDGLQGAQRNARRAPKIALADFNGNGLLDLIIGAYNGDVYFVPNTGTPATPKWDQPRDLNTARINMGVNRPWKNILAPTVVDWNRNGRPDLLLGEGSYSANAIRLFQSSRAGTPDYSNVKPVYIAYGEGREQLVPTVADLNGDGRPDLIIGDRRGEISLYLNPGDLGPEDAMPFTSALTFGNTRSFGGCAAPFAIDWNGNGLTDLLVGKANGRIALALNSGSREQPEFGTPVELDGTPALTRPIRNPSGWSTATGFERGNAYATISVVTAEDDPAADPPEGKACLRIGYSPSPNRLLPRPPVRTGQAPRPDVANASSFSASGGRVNIQSPTVLANSGGPDFFVARQTINRPLKIGAKYELSFRYKANGVQSASWSFSSGAAKVLSEQRRTGARGSVTFDRNVAADQFVETAALSNSSSWTEVKRAFTIRFSERELRDLETVNTSFVDFRVQISSPDGAFYLDDVKLAEVP